ncbi:hypothetical protein M422DRAFT_24716 [Sphaerobolus stellatus SS14]|nr:hypothetical protein M422DRAFT_24716 [Sphaerobolus stellatus SS14]
MLLFHSTLFNSARRCSPRFATTVAAGGTADPLAYCKELVHKHDYPSFLCGQFYPKSQQPGYFGLKAFFLELAMVQETVSSQVIGKMRFQFWRDAVAAIAENRPPRQPIALALHEASAVAKLQPYHLKRIIDAREAELSNPSHMTLDSLSAHAESTHSTLLYLLLALRQLPEPPAVVDTLSHVASHLGIAQCYSVLLRALPYHATRGHLVIPADIAAKHGLRPEQLFRNLQNGRPEHVHGLEDAVYDFAVAANDQLLTAKSMFEKDVPQASRQHVMPVFLSGIPVSRYLHALEKVNFDAWHPDLRKKDWSLPWHIWRGYQKERFW